MVQTEKRRSWKGNADAGRYVSVLSDAGFKAVFGGERNTDVLLDLLNAVLPAERRVHEVNYNTAEIPGLTVEGKTGRFDLCCTDVFDGTTYIIEVQNYWQRNFFKRCVDYAAKVYDLQARRGDGGQYDIPPVYLIGILGKDEMFDRSDERWADRFISRNTVMDRGTGLIHCETINLTFVDVYRFGKELKDCHSVEDRWCYALKYGNEFHEIPVELDSEEFRRFFRACEIAGFDEMQRFKYEKDMITDKDWLNIQLSAEERGFDRGVFEGEARGEAEAKAEIARNMKIRGLAGQLISEVTGLTPEEVASL